MPYLRNEPHDLLELLDGDCFAIDEDGAPLVAVVRLARQRREERCFSGPARACNYNVA